VTQNGNNNDNSKNELEAIIVSWRDSRNQVHKSISMLFSDPNNYPTNPENLLLNNHFNLQNELDRTNWKHVKFGDYVNCLKEVVDPDSGEIDRYVAGGHMDTDNLHITRWGKIGDGYLGPAFIRRFRKGQVLYGSRRTYLKKVAYADFDGVTANTTFVLQGINGKLYQPLLPWLMLSQRFTEHSVRESKGSTNPYINWPDIAKFEFDIPSIDWQKKIADLLWDIENTAVSFSDLKRFVYVVKESTENEAFILSVANSVSSQLPRNWQRGYLIDIAELDPSPIKITSKELQVTFVPMSAVSEDGGIMTPERRPYSEVMRGFTNFAENDILFAKITPCTENGKGAIAEKLENGIGFGSTEFFVIRPKNLSDKFYLYYLTMSSEYRKQATRWMRGSAGQRRVPKEYFSQRFIAIPPPELRERYGSKLHQLDYTLRLLNKHQKSYVDFRTKLINLLFS
jgi:type I restriction enzyme S subunit